MSQCAKKYGLFLIAAWALTITLMMTVTLYTHHKDTLKGALQEARDYYRLNYHYRVWNAKIGGLYAPVEKVKPNPYHITPSRDVTTSDAKQLTLVNSAYMSRMVFELIKADSSMPIICKLTSLKVVNPDNTPDEWEREALTAFEQSGITERSHVISLKDNPYLQLISRLVTDETCLECHESQGYRVGDIRGGLSIAIPLAPYLLSEAKTRNIIVGSFLVLLLTGSTGLALFSRKRYTQEETLRESEEKFQTVCDCTQDWEYWIDVDGSIIYTSPSCSRLTGYVPADFHADPCLIDKLIHPDDMQLWKSHNHAEDSLTQQQTYELEIRIIARDATVRWISHVSRPVFVEDGTYRGRRVSNRDITERKQSEETLRQSTIAIQDLYDNAPCGYHSLDKNGMVVEMNQTGLKWLGYVREEVVGKMIFTDLLAAEFIESYRKNFTLFKERGWVKDLEYDLIRKDNTILSVLLSATAIHDIEGNFMRSRASWHDITERKKSEALIQGILESVDEGFIIVDRNFTIMTANRAFAANAKMPMEELIGKPCYEVSHHRDKPCHEFGEDCSITYVFETGKPHSALHTHHDSKGNPAYIETRAYPLELDNDGKVVTAIELHINVTEQYMLEQQLRQAQKMEAIGQLASGIAHDFNNMLTAITGYGQLTLMAMGKNNPQRQYVEQMLAASDRAAHLTKDLLIFSRKQVGDKKPVDLNEVIKTIDKFIVRIIGEDITCKNIYSEGAMPVVADSHQIEQVLMNLATNARDAMPRGGVFTITIEDIMLDQEFITYHGYGKLGRYALLTVSDSGMGMDEETRQRLFEPFFTTKEVGKGTGLGMAVVYGIVKQHDGYIQVYSEPGMGTTFKIYLPVSALRVGNEKIELEAEKPERGTETILVAEDDESVRNLTVSILQDFGYEVIVAVDGEDATKKYRENQGKIQLLLFDLIMPKKNGKEAYEEISEINPGVKVIFVSGYTPEAIRHKVVVGGGMILCCKPFSPTDLLKKVRSKLDENRELK